MQLIRESHALQNIIKTLRSACILQMPSNSMQYIKFSHNIFAIMIDPYFLYFPNMQKSVNSAGSFLNISFFFFK